MIDFRDVEWLARGGLQGDRLGFAANRMAGLVQQVVEEVLEEGDDVSKKTQGDESYPGSRNSRFSGSAISKFGNGGWLAGEAVGDEEQRMGDDTGDVSQSMLEPDGIRDPEVQPGEGTAELNVLQKLQNRARRNAFGDVLRKLEIQAEVVTSAESDGIKELAVSTKVGRQILLVSELVRKLELQAGQATAAELDGVGELAVGTRQATAAESDGIKELVVQAEVATYESDVLRKLEIQAGHATSAESDGMKELAVSTKVGRQILLVSELVRKLELQAGQATAVELDGVRELTVKAEEAPLASDALRNTLESDGISEAAVRVKLAETDGLRGVGRSSTSSPSLWLSMKSKLAKPKPPSRLCQVLESNPHIPSLYSL
jgi:hypothetical protein